MRGWLGLLACGGILAAEPILTVRVYSYEFSASERLAHAEQEAGRILRQAGIQTAWIDCRLTALRCEKELGRNEVVLRILPHGPVGGVGRTLGYAVPGPYATIYVSEVFAAGRAASVESTVLLGIAIAHEIGHVLLGPGSHSNAGIMRPRWRPQDLQAAAQRNLGFTPTQAVKLCLRLHAPTEKAALRVVRSSEAVE